jgi:hypothetical protein
MELTVTLPNRSPLSFSGEEARYTVGEESGVLREPVLPQAHPSREEGTT